MHNFVVFVVVLLQLGDFHFMVSAAVKAVEDMISRSKIWKTLKYYSLIKYAIDQIL